MISSSRSRKKVQESKEIYEYACGPCAAESKNVEAIGYCQYCHHYLCKSCFSYHHNLGKIHVLLNKDKMPKQNMTPGPSLDPLLESCTEHKYKNIELYCKNHDEVFCVICATHNHKNCDYVFIPDFTDDLTKSPTDDCSAILALIQVLINRLEHVRSESTRRLKDLDRQKREFILEIKKFRKEIDTCLDQLEKQVQNGMKQVIDISTKELTTNITKCEEALKNLQETYGNTEVAMSLNGKNRIFTVFKISNKQLQENTAILKSVTDNSVEINIKFEENFEILKNLRKTKMLGKVSVKKETVKFSFDNVATDDGPDSKKIASEKTANKANTIGQEQNVIGKQLEH